MFAEDDDDFFFANARASLLPLVFLHPKLVVVVLVVLVLVVVVVVLGVIASLVVKVGVSKVGIVIIVSSFLRRKKEGREKSKTKKA
tara:strand:- start:119 stop:376 length:258 start_codon:yes stop_codon:yes gene_type:complete